MNNPVFRVLATGEADPGYAVYLEAFHWLNRQGIRQWLAPMRRAVFDQRQARGENFGLFAEGSLAVLVSVVYGPASEWGDAVPADAWWLHTLATAPKFRGRRLGELTVSLA